jgi:cytoskeletal protein CcmA (bactofilin family)
MNWRRIMSDTQVMNTLNEDGESLTDSQVIPFDKVPKTVSPSPETYGNNVSIIGETLHFKGELSAGEDLIIEGKIEGQINQGKCCLTVKPKGELIANVNATKIFIEGNVDGDLAATVSVSIRESGDVTGNIVAPTVAIVEGATFNGKIEMRAPSEAKRNK